MTDKLNGIEERYEKINELLCSPDIISNQQEYAKLMKEQKNLTPVVEKFREYKQYENTLTESKELLDAGGLDKDFRELVQEEFEQAKLTLSVARKSLRFCFCRRTPMTSETLLSR